MSRAKRTPAGVTLRGQRNCCPNCGELFYRISGFTKHRVGSFSPDTRRCMTVPEMQKGGFQQDVLGFWRFSKPETTQGPRSSKSAEIAIPPAAAAAQ